MNNIICRECIRFLNFIAGSKGISLYACQKALVGAMAARTALNNETQRAVITYRKPPS